MKKGLKIVLFLMALLVLAYALGPVPEFEDVNSTKSNLSIEVDEIENYIQALDAKVPDLKEDNGGKLFWDDPETKAKTEYVVLYLHGFSASGEEGGELHEPFAKAIGANLYVPRLIDHGRKTSETFKGIAPGDLLNSAKEAIAVAKKLGDKLIVVSCSTGGTYSAYLAAYDKEIEALIMYSPNIDLFDTRSNLILKPWGVNILTAIQGSDYNEITHYTEEQKKYWNPKYHNDGIIALKSLISQTMKKEHFEKITQPTMVMAYYKNEVEQDSVVSVARMREFYNQISTPADQKRFVECPECLKHVISSELFNPRTDLVLEATLDFATNVLKIPLKETAELAN